jgi:hypothetical protein
MLAQYGPDLLVTSQNSIAFAEDLVAKWLEQRGHGTAARRLQILV